MSKNVKKVQGRPVKLSDDEQLKLDLIEHYNMMSEMTNGMATSHPNGLYIGDGMWITPDGEILDLGH